LELRDWTYQDKQTVHIL